MSGKKLRKPLERDYYESYRERDLIPKDSTMTWGEIYQQDLEIWKRRTEREKLNELKK